MHPLRKLRESGKPTPAQVSELLAENIVFNSPILIRPIEGREVVATIFAQSSSTRGSGTYTAEFKLDEHTTFLRWVGTMDGHKIESLEVIVDNKEGLMSQMTLSQMSITETTASPQHKLQWLAEQALNWSGLPVVHVRPTVFLEGFLLIVTADSVRESNQIRLPFGEGKTSPVAVEDVARVVATLLENPQPHIGKIYHLTGPQSENMHFYAQEYSKALGRTITFQDIPVGPWRHGLLQLG